MLPDFGSMIDQMVSGPCIAMEIRQDNAVASFKTLCGSYDPKVGASKGETETIRQIFGQDKARNAVHCTDMPDEGVLECEYFFVLMQEKKLAQ